MQMNLVVDAESLKSVGVVKFSDKRIFGQLKSFGCKAFLLDLKSCEVKPLLCCWKDLIDYLARKYNKNICVRTLQFWHARVAIPFKKQNGHFTITPEEFDAWIALRAKTD